MLEVGDIVVNAFGHVMMVGKLLPERKVVCFYECFPEAHHLYEEKDLRFLSKTRGVEMSRECSTEYAQSIARMVEWGKGVHGVPRKYRAEKGPRQPKETKEEKELVKKFLALSPQEQAEFVKKLEG